MSRATNESLTVLAITAGVFKEIERRNLVCRVDMKHNVSQGYQQVVNAINSWDETGDGAKNTKWISDRLTAWDKTAFAVGQLQRVEELVAMADILITDLQDKVKNKRKLQGLAEIHKTIQTLLDFTGDSFVYFEKSDEMIKKLYDVMGGQS